MRFLPRVVCSWREFGKGEAEGGADCLFQFSWRVPHVAEFRRAPAQTKDLKRAIWSYSRRGRSHWTGRSGRFFLFFAPRDDRLGPKLLRFGTAFLLPCTTESILRSDLEPSQQLCEGIDFRKRIKYTEVPRSPPPPPSLLGPYSRTIPRVLRRSWGGGLYLKP